VPASGEAQAAGFGAMFRWPARLDRRLAGRYLRSRRSSRFASLHTVIATAGVAVGVMALIVVLGVMNGLRNDLRSRILVANPHLRVLTFGAGLRLDNWQDVLAQVRQEPGVVAAEPEVISQALITAGADYGEGVNLLGYEKGDSGAAQVTSLPQSIVRGDLSFQPSRSGVDGAVLLGTRLAARLSVHPGDTVVMAAGTGVKVNPAVG
jgi:lipoprotein-releasing system permease protein